MSSSIANFYPKLKAYLKLEDWHWWRDGNERVIFFGLYHWKDYLRFIWHRGPKKVFWCGSDILALTKFWSWVISKTWNDKFYVENEVEQAELLRKTGWMAEIRPMLFDDPDEYPISYKWSAKPNVYISCHKGREQEYGIDKFINLAHELPDINFHIYGIPKPELWFDMSINEMRNLYYQLPNLIYHGQVSEQQFNQEIKEYQGCIRFNKFDGFSEVICKGLLQGQHVYSSIWYAYTSRIKWIKMLQTKEEPEIIGGIEASNYWRKTLKENKDEVVDNWNG